LQAIDSLPSDLQDLTFEQLTRNLSIEQAGETGILTLRYMGRSPAEAKHVLTILGKTYTEYSLARQKLEATKGIRLIERKLPETGLALRQAGTSLRQFREKNRLNDPEALATGLISQQQGLEARYQEGVIARHAMETLRSTNIQVLGVAANGYSLSDLYGYYGKAEVEAGADQVEMS